MNDFMPLLGGFGGSWPLDGIQRRGGEGQKVGGRERKKEEEGRIRCLRGPKFSRFGRVPACDRQRDGRTDRHDDSIYRPSIASRGKNWTVLTQVKQLNVDETRCIFNQFYVSCLHGFISKSLPLCLDAIKRHSGA